MMFSHLNKFERAAYAHAAGLAPALERKAALLLDDAASLTQRGGFYTASATRLRQQALAARITAGIVRKHILTGERE